MLFQTDSRSRQDSVFVVKADMYMYNRVDYSQQNDKRF